MVPAGAGPLDQKMCCGSGLRKFPQERQVPGGSLWSEMRNFRNQKPWCFPKHAFNKQPQNGFNLIIPKNIRFRFSVFETMFLKPFCGIYLRDDDLKIHLPHLVTHPSCLIEVGKIQLNRDKQLFYLNLLLKTMKIHSPYGNYVSLNQFVWSVPVKSTPRAGRVAWPWWSRPRGHWPTSGRPGGDGYYPAW